MFSKAFKDSYPFALKEFGMASLSRDRIMTIGDIDPIRLRVGHCTYLPPPLLAKTLRLGFDDFHGTRIEHLTGLTPTIVSGVIEGTLQAGFGYLPVRHPDLRSYVLYEEPLMACMSFGHILAGNLSIHPRDFEDQPVIAVARELLPWAHEQVAEFFTGFGIELRVVADAFAPPEAVAMAEYRIGICLVGASAVSRSCVVARPISGGTVTQKSGLFVRRDNHNPKLRALVDMVLQEEIPSARIG